MSSKGVPASECLQKNCPVPSNVLVKDFARWYCKSRSGRLAPKPNLKSVKNILKKFFAGFQRITETEISDELTSHNLRLIIELEQWKSATSQAETLNRELEASLEAAQSDANAIQQENERIKEACRQNSLAANCFRAKTARLEAVVKEIFSALESAKAKILSNLGHVH